MTKLSAGRHSRVDDCNITGSGWHVDLLVALARQQEEEIADLKGALDATNAKLRSVNERGWESMADCEAEISALRNALSAILVVRDGKAYFVTANGIPMKMGRQKSRIVCAAIDTVRKK